MFLSVKALLVHSMPALRLPFSGLTRRQLARPPRSRSHPDLRKLLLARRGSLPVKKNFRAAPVSSPGAGFFSKPAASSKMASNRGFRSWVRDRFVHGFRSRPPVLLRFVPPEQEPWWKRGWFGEGGPLSFLRKLFSLFAEPPEPKKIRVIDPEQARRQAALKARARQLRPRAERPSSSLSRPKV